MKFLSSFVNSASSSGRNRPWLASILMLLLSFSATPTWAHFLWFDQPAVVATGDTVPVKLYFGEYHENLREIKGGRLDERSGTKLHLLAPTTTRTKNLSLKQNHNHFKANFSAKDSGLYDLIATDHNNPVVDWTKYGIGVVRPIFYARSQLLSFNEGEVSERSVVTKPQLDFDIIPLIRAVDVRAGTLGSTIKQEIPFQVFFKGKPFIEKADISIYAPNGWLWQARLDNQGMGRFTPLWPGVYVVDIVYLEKTPGEFSGKAYEAVRHRTTLTLQVRDLEKITNR